MYSNIVVYDPDNQYQKAYFTLLAKGHSGEWAEIILVQEKGGKLDIKLPLSFNNSNEIKEKINQIKQKSLRYDLVIFYQSDLTLEVEGNKKTQSFFYLQNAHNQFREKSITEKETLESNETLYVFLDIEDRNRFQNLLSSLTGLPATERNHILHTLRSPDTEARLQALETTQMIQSRGKPLKGISLWSATLFSAILATVLTLGGYLAWERWGYDLISQIQNEILTTQEATTNNERLSSEDTQTGQTKTEPTETPESKTPLVSPLKPKPIDVLEEKLHQLMASLLEYQLANSKNNNIQLLLENHLPEIYFNLSLVRLADFLLKNEEGMIFNVPYYDLEEKEDQGYKWYAGKKKELPKDNPHKDRIHWALLKLWLIRNGADNKEVISKPDEWSKTSKLFSQINRDDKLKKSSIALGYIGCHMQLNDNEVNKFRINSGPSIQGQNYAFDFVELKGYNLKQNEEKDAFKQTLSERADSKANYCNHPEDRQAETLILFIDDLIYWLESQYDASDT